MNQTELATCVECYRRLKNLKLVSAETRIPWQTVYWNLKKAGEPVTGDKERYGSDKDRLAARSERLFQELVPEAQNCNRDEFQSKVDFIVHGYKVDIKSSRLMRGRWAFSLKKQELLADFFVCFAFDEARTRVLIIPGEICRRYQTLSLSASRHTKWWDYEVAETDVHGFFMQAAASKAA